LATFRQYGSREMQRSAPAVVSLVATSAIQFAESPGRDNRVDFASISANTELFEMYDYSTGTQGSLLGKIVSKSGFVASQWGDDGLFFKHQRMEDAAQD
jgi:hypothetical protein